MNPRTRYARNEGGQYIAYQTFGEGAVDLVFIPDWCTNLEIILLARPRTPSGSGTGPGPTC